MTREITQTRGSSKNAFPSPRLTRTHCGHEYTEPRTWTCLIAPSINNMTVVTIKDDKFQNYSRLIIIQQVIIILRLNFVPKNTIIQISFDF